MQQISPLQVGMAMRYASQIWNRNDWLVTHQADTLTKGGGGEEGVEDTDNTLE